MGYTADNATEARDLALAALERKTEKEVDFLSEKRRGYLSAVIAIAITEAAKCGCFSCAYTLKQISPENVKYLLDCLTQQGYVVNTLFDSATQTCSLSISW